MSISRILAVVALGTLPLLAACGSDSSTTATAPVTTVAGASGVKLVTPAEGKQLIDSMGQSLTVIDVRTPSEFAAGHLFNAKNIDLEGGQFSQRIAELPKDAAYIVYCHSGRRSAIATATMATAGFTEIYDLGGIAAWQAAGLPTVTG